MKIIGDIGNTEVKICLVDKNFNIKKKINIKTSEITLSIINIKLNKIIKNKNKIENIVFIILGSIVLCLVGLLQKDRESYG